MLNKIFEKFSTKQKALTVLDAYSMTRYGVCMDKETLKKRIIERIQELIKSKSLQGYYSLVFDLDENLPDLNLQIANYYLDLGFNCFILDNTVNERIETCQLYLSWKTKNL